MTEIEESHLPQTEPPRKLTPKWEKYPGQIASDIAGEFYPVASLFHADLRRQIIKVIEAEREVTKHYMTQMGRWWERLGK